MTLRATAGQAALRLLAIGATVLWASGTSCTQITKDAYTDSVYSAQDLSQPQLLIQSGHNHNGWVNSVAFSPDGKMLASGSYADDTIKIWSTDTGKLLITLLSFIDGNWIAYVSEGYYISSEGASKYITWRVGSQIYEFNQFKSRFNQPDLVAARLKGQ